MSYLRVMTATGVWEADRAECLEQLHDWDTYCMADNFAGWLYKRAIMDGLDLVAARARTEDLLRWGSNVTIDVRID